MKESSSTFRQSILLAMLVIALLPLCTLMMPPAEAQTDNRGINVQASSIGEWPGSEKRFALIIGVDQYTDTQIAKLDGAANDAKAIVDALVRYAGFPSDQVILLASDQPIERQPTRANILRRLSNLSAVVPKDGLLVVAFSGHGIERGGRAFLLPSDAQMSDDVYLLEQTAISVIQVGEQIRRTGVGQVLLLLDACRNNPTGRGESVNPLTENYTRGFNFDIRNREVAAFVTLYATAVGQQAYEYKEKKQGYFSWALVEGLRGEAANEKGEVTLARLISYLQDRVPKRVLLDLGPGKEQRPFAVVEGYKADELVVAVARPGRRPRTKSDVISNKSSSKDVSASSLGLKIFVFEVATINPSGKVSQLKKEQTRYFTEDLGSGEGLEMVEIPEGKFQMGSSNEEIDRFLKEYEQLYKTDTSKRAGRLQYEMPQHTVNLSSFFIGKFEITQAQWRAVANLPKIKRDLNPDPSYFKGNKHPVEQVSHEDALEFCARLSRKTGRFYRLPSEAEWEYACRAGTQTAFHFGENITSGFVNYLSRFKSEGKAKKQTWPAGSMRMANAFGLYDMHGNVAEWCLDQWHDSYQGAPYDGSAWLEGDKSLRLVRGGAWNADRMICRSATRYGIKYDSTKSSIGFRVVMGRLLVKRE
jgi:formylglycine-generating enzyme required for sulfatase activity